MKESHGILELMRLIPPGCAQGFLVCGVFDLEKIEAFNAAAAMVESSPDNPIGTLERFPLRKIKAVNKYAEALGIRPGMDVTEAFGLIA